LCPEAVFLPPDFPTYREASREVMDIVRAHVERSRSSGLDEAYLDLDRAVLATRGDAPAGHRDQGSDRSLTCSVGIGPNKLVAKVASDAEKPAGFVVLTREQACARFAASPPGLVPGIGPKTAARLAALGLTTLARVGAGARADARRALRAKPRARAGRRARFEHDGEVGAARKVVSESRERTFDEDISDPAELREALRRMAGSCARASPRTAQWAHDRDQGPPRRLHDGHARPFGRRSQPATASWSRRSRCVCSRSTRQPRPVRLLGVRVAGLSSSRADALAPGDSSAGDETGDPDSAHGGGIGRPAREAVGKPACAARYRIAPMPVVSAGEVELELRAQRARARRC
jgi:DNA polymerase-4